MIEEERGDVRKRKINFINLKFLFELVLVVLGIRLCNAVLCLFIWRNFVKYFLCFRYLS